MQVVLYLHMRRQFRRLNILLTNLHDVYSILIYKALTENHLIKNSMLFFIENNEFSTF